jgi:uncharacterized coiled-coil protein SlyX
LTEQQHTLAAQGRVLDQLQAETSRNNADLQALTQRLQDLSELCKNLEPLLLRLNAILDGR